MKRPAGLNLPGTALPDGTEGNWCIVWHKSTEESDNPTEYCGVEFRDRVSSQLLLRFDPRGIDAAKEDNAKAPFEFLLEFDPEFTAQGRHYKQDKVQELDGQRIRITGIDVYPSYLSFSIEGAPENTAWLTGLDYYLLTEDGTRYDWNNTGVFALWDPEKPEWRSFRTDSLFFRDAASVTLCVTGASWMQKGAETQLDLKNGTAEGLPANVELVRTVREGSGWRVTLLVRINYSTRQRNDGSVFLWRVFLKREENESAMDNPQHTAVPGAPDRPAPAAGRPAGKLRRIWKYLLCPLAVVLALLCVFMLVINTSSRAAAACGKIPVLRELTEALRFSGSRFVTVDNEACQPVQQLLTWEDVAVRVDFLVIDENRMTVFYQVESDRETPLSALASLESAGGQGESEWTACNEYSEGPLKGLSSVTGIFPEGVPADLRLRVEVSAPEEGDQAAFRHVFLCYPDYSVREPAVRHYDLDRTLDLWTEDGRTSRIRVTGLDVSADHVRFTLEALPDNPYWFDYLHAFVETPYRSRYDPSDFAAVKYDMAYDTQQTYMGHPYFFFHEGTEEEQAVLQVDGVLFNGASSLTLGIAGMAFESKAAHVTAHLDLANGTSDSMPEGTELVRIVPLEDGWRITLLSDGSQNFFQGYDAKGRPLVRLNWDYAQTDPDDPAGEAAPEGRSYMFIDLKDYPYDEIWLDDGFGMEVQFDRPVLETFDLTGN